MATNDNSGSFLETLDKYAGLETPSSQPGAKGVDGYIDGGIPENTVNLTTKEEYKPAEKSSRAVKRIRIITRDGDTTLVSYALLIRVLLAKSGEFLTLIFSDIVVILQGRNLAPLLPLLQEDKISALVCFNPDIHVPPAQSTPCIGQITEQSIKEFRGEE